MQQALQASDAGQCRQGRDDCGMSAQASMEMEGMGFKGAIHVGVELLDRFRDNGARPARSPVMLVSACHCSRALKGQQVG